MKVSIVIPMRDEAKNIPTLINKIKREMSNIDFEIIAINDGSTDNTKEVLEKIHPIKIINREKQNRVTVGEAIRDGFKLVTGDIIVIMDSDLSHNPKYIPLMIEKLKESDLVIASRFMAGGFMNNEYGKKNLTRMYNAIARSLLKIRVMDFTHGFKAFKSEILNKIELTSTGFSIYAEIPIKAHVKGFKLAEIPMYYDKRKSGTSKFRYISSFIGYSKFIIMGVLSRWKR